MSMLKKIEIRLPKLYIIIMIIISLFPITSKSANNFEKTLIHVQKEMPVFTLTHRKFSKYEIEYFNYYKLNFFNCNHYFGKMDINGFSTAAHLFTPQNAKATMIIVHGYYDHTGVVQGLIKHYLDLNFNVIVYDHPGHGLTSGERNSIDDFSQYTSVLSHIISFTEKNLTGPYSITTHSMGCAITIDYLQRNTENNFKNIFFIAPLFHIAKWDVIVKVNDINGKIIDVSPRILRNNTKNRDFKKFVAKDPLQSRILSSKWVNALIGLNERLESSLPLKNKITVIQGTNDTTVDWIYNIEQIKKHVPSAEIIFIEGAGHQLMNEIDAYKNQLYYIIDSKI